MRSSRRVHNVLIVNVFAVSDDGVSNRGGDTVEKTVRDLLGPEQKVVSVHKKPEEVVEEDEVIMVNGNPITLTGKRFKFGLTLILKIPLKCTIFRPVFPKKGT